MDDFSDYEFSEFPAGGQPATQWKITRTPAARPLRVRVISTHVCGVLTHHFGGRTMGHLALNCDACKAGNQARWTGYVLGQDADAERDILFEFSEAAGTDMKEIIGRHGHLRGLAVLACRPSKKKNGRVELRCDGNCSNPAALSPEVDIPPLLRRLWRMKDPSAVAIETAVSNEITESAAAAKATWRRQSLPSVSSIRENGVRSVRDPVLIEDVLQRLNGHAPSQ